ncbi:unnamed protein product [Cochlearia groenlandica]
MEPPKIFLRPFNISDAEDVFKWASDDDVTRYASWNSFKIVEESQRFILRMAIPYPWRRSISLLHDDRSIGYVSVVPHPGDGRCPVDRLRANLGYIVAKEFWGHGIATAAVRIAVEQAFGVFPALVRIEAMVIVENKASHKVLEKVGFVKEGGGEKNGMDGKLVGRGGGIVVGNGGKFGIWNGGIEPGMVG